MTKVEENRTHVDFDAVLSGATSARSGGIPRGVLKWSAAAAVAGLALWAALSLRAGSGDTRYATDEATRGNLVVTVTATGSVQPTNKVDVSSELSGIVRKVLGRLQLAGQGRRGAGRARHRQAQGDRRQLARQAQRRQGQGGRGRGDRRREGARLQPQERRSSRSRSPRSFDFEAAKAAFDRAVAALRERTRRRRCRRGRSCAQRDQPRQGLDPLRRSAASC